jgi:hypothetical protein
MMFHLIPAFGAQLLRTITRDQMQLFLDKKAENLSSMASATATSLMARPHYLRRWKSPRDW